MATSFPITAENMIQNVFDIKESFDSGLAIPNKGCGGSPWPNFYRSAIYPDYGPGGKGGSDPMPPIVRWELSVDNKLEDKPSEDLTELFLAAIGIAIESI